MSFKKFCLTFTAVAAMTMLVTFEANAQSDVTFSEHVAPILYDNCVHCHRAGGVAPMPLTTYDEVRPWAAMIKYKTQLRDKMGAMPPYYLERDIGIQNVKDDERLSEEELQIISDWVAAEAPQGNPAALPAVPQFDDSGNWKLGEPDLIVKTGEVFVQGDSPDWWGEIDLIPTGLTEDRYVAAVEMREVNDADPNAGGETVVGGRWVVHHMSWMTTVPGEEDTRVDFPTHELGRNPDVFDEKAARLLRAGSSISPLVMHLHSNGQDTTAHLEIGFYLQPVGYEPALKPGRLGLGDGLNISVNGNDPASELHSYAVLKQHTKISSFEPHLHAPGARVCLEAIWGNQIETLACSGYDHNWVKQYTYEDDYAPLLPKGTIVHLIAYMDNSASNPNVVDSRNWSGSGNRSVSNMFLHIGHQVSLTDEQFVQEMAGRRERLGLRMGDHLLGCPLCGANIPPLGPEDDSSDE
ncbi:MAG: cytochrome c [Gammaproteobacteria bacterium]|nr:cytochrome c [Gammaproteobacteria bacterium]